ncbi:MAG TPA: helix-turn-helix transcriptional regulator [Edaphobacter sp.]|nr:helix-turn-helix transcriptional regulator [Edaphobacter sp.]
MDSLAFITDCDIVIAICNMKLSDKIRYLREVEGNLRGLNRAMTQQELVRAIQESNKSASRKAGATISQSYLSQIESGARPHLTNTTRLLLAKFFKVHPGYLVDDPEGYNAQLMADIHTLEDKLDLWLISGAERFRRDPELCQALLTLAQNKDSRRCLLLLEEVLKTPSLADRLLEVLRPESAKTQSPASASLAQPKPVITNSRTKRGTQ